VDEEVPLTDPDVVVTIAGRTFTTSSAPAIVGGELLVDELLPGTYSLQVSNVRPAVFDPITLDEISPAVIVSHPVTAQISIPRGTVFDTGGSLPVTATLPDVGATLTGTIAAVALNGERPVRLPAGYEVTRMFTPPPVLAGAGPTPSSIPNTAPAPFTSPAAIPASTCADTTDPTDGLTDRCASTFTFTGAPLGTSVLEPPVIPGFEPITPATRDITATSLGINTLAGDITYRARNVNVRVTVTDTSAGSPGVTGATVTLTPPTGGTPIVGSALGGGVYAFEGAKTIAPDADLFTLSVTSELHAPYTAPVAIDPTGAAGDPTALGTVQLSAVLTPSSAAILVYVQLQNSPGVQAPITQAVANLSTTSVTLQRVDNNGVPQGSPIPTTYVRGSNDANSYFRGELLVAGRYRATVVVDGYRTQTDPVSSGNIPLGKTESVTLVVPKLAAAAVTATKAGGGSVDSVVITSPAAYTDRVPTQSSSTFTFTGLDFDLDYTFEARAANHRSDTITATEFVIGGTLVVPTPPATFTILPFAIVEGVVRNGSGTAVSGASVTATRTSPASPPLSVTTSTDGTGKYRVDLDTGVWSIVATKDGVGTGSTTTTVTARSADVRVSTVDPVSDGAAISLGARDISYVFTVTVTDADGDPIQGATVEFGTAPYPTTDADGRATFLVKEDAPRGYTVRHPLYLTRIGTADETVNGEAVDEPVFMRPRPVVSGIITRPDDGDTTDPDSADDPVVGATVRISNGTTSYTTTSIAGGAYSFVSLTDPLIGLTDVGTWTVTASTAAEAGIATSTVVIETTTTGPITRNVLLAPLATTTFTVNGPDGGDGGTDPDPIAGAVVTLTGTTPSATIIGLALPGCTTSAGGTGNPPAGSCTVQLPTYVTAFTYSVTATGFQEVPGTTAGAPPTVNVLMAATVTPP
jgi:hypothetical protein